MRLFLCSLLFVCLGCSKEDPSAADHAKADAALLGQRVESLYHGLRQAFRGAAVNTDSLLDAHFAPDVYYVTYWGTAEPIDTTKARFRSAKPLMKEYENHVELIQSKVSGDLGYAFFILRQNYMLAGRQMEEYLPTTFIYQRRPDGWKVIHAQRSADLETTGRFFGAVRDSVRH
jgi:hypothetical protein